MMKKSWRLTAFLSLGLLGAIFCWKWAGGFLTPALKKDPCEICKDVLPEADAFLKVNHPLYYKAFRSNPRTKKEELLGYAFLTTDLAPDISGFIAPIKILVGIDTAGTIVGIKLVSHAETSSYVGNLSGYLKQFVSKDIHHPFQIGKDIDGITGATISSEATARSIQKSLEVMGEHALRKKAPDRNISSQQDAGGMKRLSSIKEEALPPPIIVEPQKGIDVHKVKAEIQKSGLVPREAKYWKSIEGPSSY